jgi:hypothetical protein
MFVKLGTKVVLVPLSDFLQQFIILIAVLAIKEIPTLAVFLVMYLHSVLIGCYVNIKPFYRKSKLY